MEYKCPNCTGDVKFDDSSREIKCPHCNTEFEIQVIEEYQKELAVPAADNYTWETGGKTKEWEAEELDNLTAGYCPSCYTEFFGEGDFSQTLCPNCGNAQITRQPLEGMLKPDYIIPFKLDKDSAAEVLKNFFYGKRLLPGSFLEENNINNIRGAYIPFWLFDAEAKAHICYRASKTKIWSDINYNYTKTYYYSVVRSGSIAFEKIPVNGLEKLDDSYIEAVEPFDYAGLEDFKAASLAGYIAEKYNADAEASRERAYRRIKAGIEKEFARTAAGYTALRIENSQVDVEGGQVNYALFPVWILNIRYKEENYQFFVNGQSGLLAGRMPVDSDKVWKYRIMLAGIIGTALTLLIQILRILM